MTFSSVTYYVQLEFRKTDSCGKGLFTLEYLPAGTLIGTIQEPLIHVSQVPIPLKPEDDHYLQVWYDLFVGTFDNILDPNHSCDPNCAIKVSSLQASLITLREVKSGEELTFDYSLTSTDSIEVWALKCRCNSDDCRRIISGYHTMNRSDKERCLALGLVPDYVLKHYKM